MPVMRLNRLSLAGRARELVVLALIVWCVAVPALRNLRERPECIDFTGFYSAGQKIAQHQPLYSLRCDGVPPYVYSPALADIVAPLTRFPRQAAQSVWLCLEWLSLIAAVVMAFGLRKDRSLILPAIAIAMVFHFWPTSIELFLGNVNALLLLAVGALYAAERSKRRWLVPIIITGGALIKTWFLGMIAYLLITRRWRAALASIALCAGGLAFLFAPLGLAEWMKFLQLNSMFLSGSGIGDYQVPQSIFGFARIHFETNHWVVPLTINHALHWVVVAAGLSIVVAGLYYLSRLDQSERAQELRLGMVACSLLLMIPMCDIAYLILALPLLWTIITSSKTPPLLATAAFFVYACGTRIHWSTGGLPPRLYSGVESFLFSDGFIWLCAAWCTGLAASIAHQRSERKIEAVCTDLPANYAKPLAAVGSTEASFK